MKVFRLVRKKYKVELSGVGASLVGARWNSKGTEIIYCAESRALAMAEIAVHLSISNFPDDFVMLTIEIPEQIVINSVNIETLSNNWNTFPNSNETPTIGDDFVKKNIFCVLKVPSAIVKSDYNFLINPYHSDFKKIRIINQEDFPFDKRIFKN